MSFCEVLFLPHNKKIRAEKGRRLIRAALEAGVHINASCGGGGVCGKCRVVIEAGEVEDGISEKLDQKDIDKGIRLACQARIQSDLTVCVPVDSAFEGDIIESAAPGHTTRIRQFDFNSLKEKGLFLPPVEKIYLALSPPSAQDNAPDVSRLVGALRQQHDEHRLEVLLAVIRKIPTVLRAEDFKITATLLRPVRKDKGKTRIINVQPGDKTERNYAVAVDVGTTTVYGQLVDLKSGQTLAQHGLFNEQISYGEDVISRIMFAEKRDGLNRLHTVVIKTINTILARIIKDAQVDADDISTITLAGNTTMTQLLLEITPNHMRRSPYVPASSAYPPINAAHLGLVLPEHVSALVFPAVSSYVGGDIIAGIMGSGMYREDKLTLYIDIGTNAEIVIGNSEWLACAACSAGPAFEGGGVKFGMRAAKGAIEDFSIDPATLEPMIITIGNVRPKGICGSGLITMTAVLFEMGIINNLGKFDRDLGTERIREVEGVWEYVLAWAHETQIDRDVVLTEPDIDNLIRAKGAVYSGSITLLEEVGLKHSDLQRIILAGGFGSHVDLYKAMTIGLLPEMEADKIVFIGNGSLMGAKMSCLTNRIRQDVAAVTQKMTNFELSETGSYMDHYVAALFLPHTDMDRFPKLKARLKLRQALK